MNGALTSSKSKLAATVHTINYLYLQMDSSDK